MGRITEVIMPKEKKPIEYYQDRPEEYSITKTGNVKDRTTGRIVTTFPELNPHAITTSERGRELANMRRALGTRSKMLGLIDAYNEKTEGEKIDPDTLTDEELILAAGDALRLMHKHMGIKFLDSANLRGMGETYTKLVEPFAEDPNARGPIPQPGQITAGVDTLLRLVDVLERERAAAVDRGRAIEGKTI
jgi:hypothetical protein